MTPVDRKYNLFKKLKENNWELIEPYCIGMYAVKVNRQTEKVMRAFKIKSGWY